MSATTFGVSAYAAVLRSAVAARLAENFMLVIYIVEMAYRQDQ